MKLPKLGKKNIVYLGAGVIVVAIGVLLLINGRDKSNTTVETIKQSSTKTTVTPSNPITTTPQTYSDNYISFTYPAGLSVMPMQKSGSYLDLIGLYSSDKSGKGIAIGVAHDSIDKNSSVKQRSSNTATYKVVSKTANSIVFSKNQSPAEYTAFLSHNDLLATITISASSLDGLEQIYQTIAKDWQWK